MIISYRGNGVPAQHYSVFDAETGECLDHSCRYFYADDEAGYLLSNKRDDNGHPYLWDSRTGERVVGPVLSSDPRAEFLEVAWERIDRKIVIRPKDETAAGVSA
jgi:hypothetical protein